MGEFMMGVPNVIKKLMERVCSLFVLGVVIRVQIQLQSKFHVVEAKLHGESKVIQRCFDDNNDDNKR